MFGLIFFSGAPSLVTGLLLGSWSDKVGRKPAICLPCFGAAVDMSLTLVVIYFDLPLYMLFAGSFFNGMTGYFPAVIIATMAYISDTTEKSMRATKLGECRSRGYEVVSVMVGSVQISLRGRVDSKPYSNLNDIAFSKGYLIGPGVI